MNVFSEIPGFLVLQIVLAGYLFGSIPTAYWLGRLVYRIDIFEHGSRNMGATNVHRVLGRGPFIFTLALDIAKGILAVFVAGALAGPSLQGMPVKLLGGFSAIIGHTLSIWVRFRGGKGVATGLGVFLALAPASSVCALFVFLGVLALSGYVSLGSIFASASLPMFILVFRDGGDEWKSPLAIFAGFVAAFIIYKHKANIGRIMRGEENSLHSPKETKPRTE